MNLNSKILSSTLALSFFMVACGEQKNLHEMHDATVEMRDTTKEMNKKTETLAQTSGSLDTKTGKLLDSTVQLSDKTDKLLETSQTIGSTSKELRDTTNELYDALRQGNALQQRRDAWDAVLNASSLPKKISEAGKYFMSYEVQLWNLYGQDGTEDKRDVLSQQATQEFFLEIESLADGDGSIYPTAMPDSSDSQWVSSKDNLRASFNAMAIALHQMNRKQAVNIEAAHLQPVSMLSLAEEALLSRSKIQSGTDLGGKMGFIREVLAHEAKAIQLIQARYNLFPLIFIDEITHIHEKGFLARAKMALLGWTCDLNTLSPLRMQYLNSEVLTQAIEARDFLKKIGVEPKLDSTVARLLDKMTVKASGQNGALAASEQTQMMGLLDNLKKGK